MEKVFNTYREAEQEILDELAHATGVVRMFLQIGTTNIGVKGSLYDLIEQASRRDVELRILHASYDSPVFSRERLLSIGKNPDIVLSTIDFVDESLRELSLKQDSSLRERTHSWPYIWRIYGFEKRLYLMPYFAKKNATDVSPVLVFFNKANSLYSTYVSYFDYLWEQNAGDDLYLSDIITPSAKASSALLLNWEEYYVFAIMKKSLDCEQDFIKVSGVGGKRTNFRESLADCAFREGNEETGDSIEKLLQVKKTKYINADSTEREIRIVGESISPHLIIEQQKNSSGNPEISENYYLVIYKAKLKKKPHPSNEIAALLFISRTQMAWVKEGCSIGELCSRGAIIEVQDDVQLDANKIIKPHGLFSHIISRGGALL